MQTKHFIITGIPRSGTSLLCHLFNQIDSNLICMNEIPTLYNVEGLPFIFKQISYILREEQKIPARVDASTEKSITDTQSGKNEVKSVDREVDFNRTIYLGSKINVPYLLKLDKIFSYDYKVIAVVRDPVYTIASWNKHENINERYVMPEDFEKWPRYSQLGFKSTDKTYRQIELWLFLAAIILKNIVSLHVLKYEDLIKNPVRALYKCLKYIGCDNLTIEDSLELDNLNKDERFTGQGLSQIVTAIDDSMPENVAFGYPTLTHRRNTP